MHTKLILSTFLFIVLPACGGNVSVEGTGAGGSTSTATTSSPGGSTTTTVTTGTTTGTTITDTGTVACDTFGAVGAGLSCSPEGTACHMDYACCQGILVCQNGTWTAQTPDCHSACLSCGDGLSCAFDGICVHDTSVHDYYQCMKNPCPGMPDCMCAGIACEMNFQQCQSTLMYTVTCG